MRCINCFELLNLRNQKEICPPCRSNPEVMISATNAKKKYMLTKDEIEKSKLAFEEDEIEIDLFFCKITPMHVYGSKYLVNDIEDLASKIFECVDDDDKRKQKYLKNVDDEKLALLDDMRENIQVYLEENDIDPEDDILSFIEEVIKRKYETDLSEVIGIIRRKIKLDGLVNEHDAKFIKQARKHRAYGAYVYGHKLSLTETFDKINKDIEHSIILKTRTKKIDKFIKENVDKSFVVFLMGVPIYKKYTTQFSCNIKFETVCKRFLEHVNRKKSLDKLIIKNVDKQYHDFARELFEYEQYVIDLSFQCGPEIVCKIILDRVNNKIARDNRTEKIDSISWIDAAIDDSDINSIYSTYTGKGGDINDAIKNIKNIIIKRDERKTNEIDKLINKMGLADIKSYEDVKFDFLVGRIGIEDAKAKLIEIKNNI
uniref:Uncharacterized protein n=1 Tax=viral metagenome TaxID=1070528 RepID=A0A6C0C7D5_9ZZZZ